MNDTHTINPRRIGDGWGRYIAAMVFFVLAAIIARTAVNDPGAAGLATGFFSGAGLFFMIGFAIGVVGKIEQRLMDIEAKLASPRVSAKALETV